LNQADGTTILVELAGERSHLANSDLGQRHGTGRRLHRVRWATALDISINAASNPIIRHTPNFLRFPQSIIALIRTRGRSILRVLRPQLEGVPRIYSRGRSILRVLRTRLERVALVSARRWTILGVKNSSIGGVALIHPRGRSILRVSSPSLESATGFRGREIL
jgi:hypothetical protein